MIELTGNDAKRLRVAEEKLARLTTEQTELSRLLETLEAQQREYIERAYDGDDAAQKRVTALDTEIAAKKREMEHIAIAIGRAQHSIGRLNAKLERTRTFERRQELERACVQ